MDTTAARKKKVSGTNWNWHVHLDAFYSISVIFVLGDQWSHTCHSLLLKIRTRWHTQTHSVIYTHNTDTLTYTGDIIERKPYKKMCFGYLTYSAIIESLYCQTLWMAMIVCCGKGCWYYIRSLLYVLFLACLLIWMLFNNILAHTKCICASHCGKYKHTIHSSYDEIAQTLSLALVDSR